MGDIKMPTYEQKLTEFAQGKRLVRLARPIRDRADAFCDACGSTRPRTLYALEDPDSKRHFFVGDTCLKELAKRGAILRYGRHSGRAEFENEMRLRSAELQINQGVSANMDASLSPGEQKLPVSTPRANLSSDPQLLYPAILVIETADEYQAFAYGISARDGTHGWGHAREARYQKVWRHGGEGGLVLEQERVERPDAIGQCISKAWEEACSGRQSGKLVPASQIGINGSDECSASPDSFDALSMVSALAQLVTSLVTESTAPNSINPTLIHSTK